ncbi:AraC family transcriptional regulator [Streptomyces filamentosus]|uniref:AraC family transcriptional regulator n=1 Tax=Streptomyces filamentosus TaxID=67294 RepID=UPI0037D0ED35
MDTVTATVAARAVLHYVLDGGCRIAVTGAAPLEPVRGELVLLPTAARHRVVPAPGGPPDASAVRLLALDGPGPPTRLLSVRTGYDRRAATPLVAGLPRAVLLGRDRVEGAPLLHGTLRLLAAPGRRTGPGDRLLALRVFEAALPLAAAVPRPPDGPRPHPGVGRALSAIESRYAEPWTVVTLAREAGMSRSAFTAAFREAVGTSPARLLTARRIREAARLLAETGLPQSAVPARVGYRSRVGFHLAFRTAYGTTPGEYRAAAPRRGGRPVRRI